MAAKKTDKPHPQERHLTDEEGCHCYDSSYPKGQLPPPPVFTKLDIPPELLEAEKKQAEKHATKGAQKDGIDKAMEILDAYYEETPRRNPHIDHGGED
jgi:hypothetical protein